MSQAGGAAAIAGDGSRDFETSSARTLHAAGARVVVPVMAACDAIESIIQRLDVCRPPSQAGSQRRVLQDEGPEGGASGVVRIRLACAPADFEAEKGVIPRCQTNDSGACLNFWDEIHKLRDVAQAVALVALNEAAHALQGQATLMACFTQACAPHLRTSICLNRTRKVRHDKR